MLDKLFAKYQQVILYNEVRNSSGKLMCMHVIVYTDISLHGEYIQLSNNNGDIFKIYKHAYFDVTHLKFNRDKIEISVANKKIKLFANYLDEVPAD